MHMKEKISLSLGKAGRDRISKQTIKLLNESGHRIISDIMVMKRIPHFF